MAGKHISSRRLRRLAVFAVAPLAVLIAAPASASVADSPRPSASVNGTVLSVVESGSTIYLGGTFTSATDGSGTLTRNNAAAIDVSTGRLTAWNPNVTGEVDAVAVSGGNVYLGGNFSAVGGRPRERLAEVDGGSGAVSAGFVHSATAPVRTLAVGGSLLYVGGGFAQVDAQPRKYLAAFDLSTGALSSSWTPTASAAVRRVRAAGGRVYVAGAFSALNGSTAHGYLGAVDPTTGATDGTFNATIRYLVFDVAVTSAGVYAAADGPGGHLRAFTLAGANRWDLTADGAFQAVTVLNGEIYAGGHYDHICSTTRTGTNGTCLDGKITRHKLASATDSGTVTGWAPQANSTVGVRALDSNPVSGTVVAGGNFTTFKYGTIPQSHIAVFG